MQDRRPRPRRIFTPLTDLARRHPDIVLAGSITLLAAMLRLYALGNLPNGLHGDEAQVGLDALRVLDSGWIGPYTYSALGQPSGHAYLTAPSVWLFGDTVFAVRLSLALTGVAAVPLLYVLLKLLTSRVEASLASLLLAVSLWHLHFSRVAHWPISYGTVALAVLILWVMAIRTGQRRWFVAAGAMLGLGLYTYNVYPVFVIAFSVWVGVYTLLFKRGTELQSWLRNVGIATAVSFAVGLPLFIFILTNSAGYFEHYNLYVDRYSILRSYDFQQADLLGKAEVIANQIKTFAGAYAWDGVRDNVDGAAADGRPMLDGLTLWLFIAGFAYIAWHWRATPHLLSLCLLLLMPLPSLLQTNATYRGVLGLAPFVCFLAAIPMALAWRAADLTESAIRWSLRGSVVVLLLAIAFINLQGYFGSWARSAYFDEVYARNFTHAVRHTDALPGDPYVYLLSEDFPIDHETRLFLAPEMRGEDRSYRFYGDRFLVVSPNREGVVLLMDRYTADDTLAELQRLYPDGETFVQRHRDGIAFILYKLPPPVPLLPPP